jgi:hypothetical protein
MVSGKEFEARGLEKNNACSLKLVRWRGTKKNQCYWWNGDHAEQVDGVGVG